MARKSNHNQEPVSFVDHATKGEIIILNDSDDTNIHSRVVSAMRNFMGYHEVASYRQGFPIEVMVRIVDRLKTEVISEGADVTEPTWVKLFTLLEDQRAERQKVIAIRKARGEMLFSDVPFIFTQDMEVIYGFGDEAIGGTVKSVEYQASMMGSWWQVTLATIDNKSGQACEAEAKVRVYPFKDTVQIAGFVLREISDAERATLSARGAIYRQFCGGSAHAAYTGSLVQKSWWSVREYRADGRVMVDMRAFQIVDPDNYRQVVGGGYDHDEENVTSEAYTIEDASLWRCAPHLYGFSFTAKEWGELKVSNLSPIQWRDDAFDKLVLPAEEKNLVRALVQHQQGTFEDIISGKGGGTIFLLHGEPGQGKTLTAETVAELLHRPLYMISVGELGTNPDELEKRLRTILDVATMWNAVLLLDEADIFLEARDEQNIVRNAMVGVFLRLLEYHQGVLFLTTNRVRNIDSAFFSRISVALRFADAGAEKRRQIWDNLLSAAKITGIEGSALAQHDINGRQIKNAIRLAQTLAKADEVEVTSEYIERTIKMTVNFKNEVMAQP